MDKMMHPIGYITSGVQCSLYAITHEFFVFPK